ncbi:MAG TPA: DUF349 domain-containing protein [Steroidobacteraceae bacterium]|nr:DUF349 domain-containing protein [Steroidobacteraceae bacterium]
MSFFSRLFRKRAPTPSTERVRTTAEAPPAAPRRPDAAALARAEEARVSEAIAAGDAAAVARWVLEGSSTRVRQAAARAITDPGQLGELIRAARGKDKNVYRILTGKRDELHAAERAARRREDEVAEAGAAIARHAERNFDAAYANALARLEARWTAVAPEASEELRREVERNLERSREVIEAHRRALEAEAARQRAAALAAEEARRQREHEAQRAAAADEERARLLEAQRQAERAKQEAEDAGVRELVGLLRQAQAALEHGGTARATRLRDTIREKLPQVRAMPPWFERKLADVDARIEELKDWKTFTVVPKRAELVQRMQSLVGADMSAEELARQIRRLRDEWRTLHRGAAEESTQDREQFEEAAERAYEPCREHFARQAERRLENQGRREALIERLQVFAAEQSGEQPDWRAVQRVLGEARREWREYAPVDQAVVKPLQARFHATLDALQARLAAEYQRNVEAKRGLIARAAQLAALDDTRQAIDEARGLQGAWKSAGFVPRQQDDVLWSEFRTHCDAVFQRSSQERESRDAQLAANEARAVALCDEAERLCEIGAGESGAGLRRVDELREEFDSLELPRAAVRDLRQRFARAAGRYDEAIRRQRAAAARQAWSGLFTAANEIRAYALGVAQGLPDAECEALHATAQEAVARLEHAPKGARGVLEQQMADAAAGRTSVDLRANEAALRLLCVRGELAAGLDTPEEDVELRREHQMRRLVEAMGRGGGPTSGEMEDLVFEWLAVGPVDAGVHAALLARFQRCFGAS